MLFCPGVAGKKTEKVGLTSLNKGTLGPECLKILEEKQGESGQFVEILETLVILPVRRPFS